MASIDAKVEATGFTALTGKTFEKILAAADEAAERSAGVMTKTRRESVDAEAGVIVYSVKRAGMLEVGRFGVHVAPVGNENEVTFVPGTYLTSQATFLFIPIGPKDSAALKSFQTFSRLFKSAVVS